MTDAPKKVALVTGAGNRLGREFALGLGQAGFRVAVHYRSHEADAAETLRLLLSAGNDGAAFAADLREPGAARKLVAEVLKRFGRLDALLHSASPWIERSFQEITMEDWDSTFRVGPAAALFLTQAAEVALLESQGSILLISDVAATRAWPRHIPHAAAKAAVNALVVNLAAALGPDIRVNGLAPGIVLPPAGLAPSVLQALIGKTPLRRPVAVSDVVDTAVMLIQNRSITGQIVAVDGGRSVV